MPPFPHLIFFIPDQWRGDVLGHLGNPAAITPNLDRLVQSEAVSFSNAYVQNPVCTPSRCSFMTSWYPHVRGHRSMFHMLQPDEPDLLRDLRKAGYTVWWGGKNDLVPGQNGFSQYCDIKYTLPERPRRLNLHTSSGWRGDPSGDRFYSFYHGRVERPADMPPDEPFVYDEEWGWILGAVDFIRNRPAGQPLCLYLPLVHPHPPYGVEDPWFSQIRRELLPPRQPSPQDWQKKPSLLQGIRQRQHLQGWSEDRWTELRATYYGMCARVDAELGMLCEVLRQEGMYDDSAIFFFSDHGDFTGDYGLVEKTQNTFEDCLARVPFIIKPPKGTPVQPGVRDALVELVDFRATVEDLVGMQPGYTHFGRSLLPLVAGAAAQHREAVFCEGGRLQNERHCMELESYQGEDGLYWPRLSLQSVQGPQHTKAVMLRTHDYKYVRRLYETDELYDLQRDPGELENRIDDPALAGVREELRDRLLTFFLETADVVPWKADQR
jgi:arylsulfatase A-like enzyme